MGFRAHRLSLRTLFAAAAIASAFGLAPRIARASDAEVTSDTAAQFYDVRSPTGETVLARRRLTTTLGVGVYDLMERPPGTPLGPDLSFRARLRYDADYGANPNESDVNSPSTLVPGFASNPVDLMYAYVEGRRFLKGYLGFKLGRQYVTDTLGWYSFDGAEVKVTTPYFVAAELYSGLEARGGMPLSTARFEANGIWRGDRTGYDPLLYPSYQPSAIAPTFGAAIESAGVTWLHGRLSYRRTYNTGGSNTTEFASGLYAPVTYSGPRISQERLGYSLDANLSKFGGAKAGVVYDLYLAELTNAYASLDGYVSKQVTVSLDYDYYQPVFDGDSIWNFFAGEPMNDFGVRANYDATDRMSFAANAHARAIKQQTQSYETNASPNLQPGSTFFPSNGVAFDEGAGVSGRYKWGEGAVGVRANGNFGDGGDRVGGDISGERIFETRYVATGRVSLWQWDDKLRPDRDATSLGYVAGFGYRFAKRSQALLEWQQDMNRLAGQRFRLMLWLTVAVTK